MAQGGHKTKAGGKAFSSRKTAPKKIKLSKSLKKHGPISVKAKRMLTSAINKNIENTLSARAMEAGSRFRIIKKPKTQDVKDRRSAVVSSALNKMTAEPAPARKHGKNV